MKKNLLMLFVTGLLMIFFTANSTYASEVDVLVNKLVEKGILSETEARHLLEEMQKEDAQKTQNMKDMASEVARETAQKTAKKEVETASVEIPSWLKK